MEFMGKLVGDLGAMASIGPMIIGEKLGLYKAMAGAGPMTAAELARKTNTYERYIHEWLCAQAASGYVDYDSATEKFSMNDEQAAAFGDLYHLPARTAAGGAASHPRPQAPCYASPRHRQPNGRRSANALAAPRC